jgi:hypothetical protein
VVYQKTRKNLTGDGNPWESVTKPAETVSTVSIKRSMRAMPGSGNYSR